MSSQAESHFFKAQSLKNEKKYESAKKQYLQAIKQSNETDVTYMRVYVDFLEDELGDLKSTVYYINKCLEVGNCSDIDYNSFACHYEYVFDKENAFKLYNKLLEINDLDYENYRNYGECLYKFGMHEQALVKIKRAIELNPDFSSLTLGIIYYELGDIKSSIFTLLNHISMSSNASAAAKYLAYIYTLDNNEQMALKYLTMSKNSSNNSLNDLLYAYYLWKIKGYSVKSESMMLKALEEYPKFKIKVNYSIILSVHMFYLILGQFYHLSEIKDFEKSLEYYNKLLKIRPYFVVGYYYKALLLYDMKDYPNALSILRNGYEINKNVFIIKQNYESFKHKIENKLRLIIEYFTRKMNCRWVKVLTNIALNYV